MTLQFLFLLLLGSQVTTSRAAWEKGMGALEQKNFAEAKRLFTTAVASNPSDPALWFYLGVSCSELNQLDEAVSALEKAQHLAPDRADVDFNLGLLYWRVGHVAKAKESYRAGLTREPNDPVALQNYASLLLKTGDTEGAIAPLLKLKDLDPASLPPRVSLIDSYLKINRRGDAERELDELLRSNLAGADDQTKLGAILIEDNDPEDAGKVLQSSLQLDPKQPKAYAALGLVLLKKRQYKEAADFFETAVHLEPDSAECAMAFANALVLWNRPNTLLAFLKSVEPKFGALPEFQHKLAFAYYGVAEFSNAVTLLENLLRANPPRQDQIYFLLAKSYLGMGKFDESENAFRKAIELNPKDPQYLESYARLLQKEGSGRLDDALAQLQEALQFAPSDPSLMLQLGLCYESKGNLNASVGFLEKAVRGEPDSVPAHVALARVYFRLGRKAEGQGEKKTIAELEAKTQQEKLTR
jgi:tetratricopeptide (TPR) repeat protein